MSLRLFDQTPSGPGLFVTIDGPNGSGKTSLTSSVATHLRASGETVHTTRQPSPTPLGDFVRAAEIKTQGRALACLVAADRHDQADAEITPRLRAGEIVVCDRYVESSLVLQRLDNVDVEYILAINAGIPRPDLRIRLLATPEVLRARIAARPQSYERRFERIAGPERELALYDQADNLLTTRYGLGATLYDTTSTEVTELGAAATQAILERRRRVKA